jgi:UDP-N-acetylglucosamine 2-epimerase (non-hydrolysing)
LNKEKIKIMVVTGTRPELIKVCVLLKLLKTDPDIDLVFVHSGQHYDDKMFSIFITDLKLPDPDYNINIGSHPNSVQTGKMLISLYDVISKEKPNIIIAQGDTNTVFAAALTAFKNNITFAHLEAGIRSFDMRMPEEVNRMLTGVCSMFNFAPTERAVQNLLNEGIFPNRIYLVGNTVVDAIKENLKIAQNKSQIEKELKITSDQKIILLTTHRPSNVDNKKSLDNIINPLLELENCRIIFPAHPRTLKKITEFGLLKKITAKKNFELISPLGYFDFIKLMSLSYLIITDSGGLQEESVILKKPCLTLRENTERPESIEIGANILVGNDSQKISKNITRLLNDEKFYNSMIKNDSPFGDGTTSKQIITIIKDFYERKEIKIPTSQFFSKIPSTRLVSIKKDEIGITIREYEVLNKCQILEVFNHQGDSIFPTPTTELESNCHIKARFL